MARKKVTLAWIANDATRRATLKKRRRGLLKKVSELSVLCDVPACVVVYGPDEAQPEVWPNDAQAREVLVQYKSMPESEQCKKRVDQSGYLNQQLFKIQEQVRKQQRENWELEMNIKLHEAIAGKCNLMDVGVEDAAVLARLIEEKMKTVKEKMAAVAATAAAATGEGKGEMLMDYDFGGRSRCQPPAPAAVPPLRRVLGSIWELGVRGWIRDFIQFSLIIMEDFSGYI
ncbi:uncharacterized protein A4U43_C09F760 [Asparagus officinalis]|uniref:MADS-box domain-containing protein n=1 Tax=Asparagus officinalis TaxID=4686 RepID=A0A5P1E474_ASPOF|nr:agamous-like MADS-box protein AGL80 [Asparagus officinalis]ONK57462.1 uncharacterized protein A4U43_C09F760 [Asparagus officinalis]